MTVESAKTPEGPLPSGLEPALRRVPALAEGTLTFTALSGGITNRNYRVDVAGLPERFVVRVGGTDTHLLGISREVEHAASVAAADAGVGPAVVDFVRPDGYLVTRFIDGVPLADLDIHRDGRLARVATTVRRFHDCPAIPGRFAPLRTCETYRALAEARGVTIPEQYEHAAEIGRRIELALMADPVDARPCHNDLLPGNLIDDGARIWIVDWEYAGMGDPFFDLGNLSVNNDLTEDEDSTLLAAYGPLSTGAERAAARLTLFRVVSDFREAMWGVLQQGISTLDVDFRGYADEHFERLLDNATSPRFASAIAALGGGSGVSAPRPRRSTT